MAEAATTTGQIDLLNIERLVTTDQIDHLTEYRKCLVHAMGSFDILRVVWELVAQLPMMQMHRMYNTEEIFKLSTLHLQELGRDALEPLKDGKQKLILCPILLPLKRKFPGKRFVLSSEDKPMEPLSTCEKVTEQGVLERIILVDRDGCFHALEGYWETIDEHSSRPHYEHHGYRQLKEVSLRQIENVDDLYQSVDGGDMVRFFWLATNFMREALDATLESARREFEKSVGVDGEGEELVQEKYLTIIRAMNLYGQVCRQVHHRYGR